MNIMPEAGDVAVIGSSVFEIHANIGHVWEVLTDFPAYGEWNPLCRSIEVDLAPGGHVRMEIEDKLKDAIVTLDYRLDAFDVRQRIAWSATFPELGIEARRDQYLQPLDAERCVYWSTDLYTGPSARDQAARNGPWVKTAFDNMALALKARCEGEGPVAPSDIAAIGQAIALYAEALDDRNLSLFDRCFTPEAEIRLGGKSFSLAAYRQLCTGAFERLSVMQHQLGPSRLLRDGKAPNRVNARTSFIATHVHPSNPAHPVMVGGNYHDRVERTAMGWRIVERVGETLWTTGDVSLLDISND